MIRCLKEMVSHTFHRLRVVAHGRRIGTDIVQRKQGADLHEDVSLLMNAGPSAALGMRSSWRHAGAMLSWRQ